jgi:hypothetical protein
MLKISCKKNGQLSHILKLFQTNLPNSEGSPKHTPQMEFVTFLSPNPSSLIPRAFSGRPHCAFFPGEKKTKKLE